MPSTPFPKSILPLESALFGAIEQNRTQPQTVVGIQKQSRTRLAPIRAIHRYLCELEMNRHPITQLAACWMMTITACLWVPRNRGYHDPSWFLRRQFSSLR
jgi:hypothetical protein